MMYTNVIYPKTISNEKLEKFHTIFSKYFSKPRVPIGTLVRKSVSLLTAYSKEYQTICKFTVNIGAEQLFDPSVCSMVKPSLYSVVQCEIFIDDEKYCTVDYGVVSTKDVDVIKNMINCVITKNKYLKAMTLENETVAEMDKYKMYLKLVPEVYFGYICRYEELGWLGRIGRWFHSNSNDMKR